jgi:hypothetical protein
VRDLDAYLDALEAERKLVAFRRNAVLAVLDTRRDAYGNLTPAAEGALAYDLARDGATRLTRLEQHIAADRVLLGRIGDALAALASGAEGDMDMFETLLAIDNALVDWLIHASPKTDEDRDKMKLLFGLHGDLDDALNTLVASGRGQSPR